MSDDEIEGMALFVAVAESKSLRAAGNRLGVSGSAVSQALRRLEERLGVVLVQRTTRSLHLTDAGERLYADAKPALDQLRAAAASVGELAADPRGTVRLHIAPAASSVLSGPALAELLAAHPNVKLDLFFSFEPVDIVAAGYDAGIRLGEVIDRDMIAVPVSGELQLLVAGAPSYFARRPKPKHPRDLIHHECLNWHPTAESPPYRWEFTEKGRDFAVDVPTRVLSNDPAINVRLARAGVGLALVTERYLRDEVPRGELVTVLDEFSTPFPGFYLYYAQRRHVSPALRALIEFLRVRRTEAPRAPRNKYGRARLPRR